MFEGLRTFFRSRDRLLAVGLFVLTFLVHGVSPNATPFDSRWTVHTAKSILAEGNADLDEYLTLLEADGFYAIECITDDGSRVFPVTNRAQCTAGHLYNSYPLATPLITAPILGFFIAATWVGQPVLMPLAEQVRSDAVAGLLRGDFVGSSAAAEVLIASLLIGLATALLYLAGRQYLNRPRAATLALIFAFCSPAWSTASRALWQHGPAMLILIGALLIVVRAERRPELIRYLGPLLALGYYVRPTLAGPLLIFTIYLLVYYRRYAAQYFLWAAPVVLVFQAHNFARYGTLLSPYSLFTRESLAGLSLHSRLAEALAGNLISPSRGLIVYVPLVLLAVYGMFLRPRHETERRLRPLLIVIVILHWLAVSTYEDWWAGHSFGPRYMSEIIPLLIWFLIPVLERIDLPARRGQVVLPAVFIVLAAASFWINCRGAWVWAVYDWNVKPVEIHSAEWRLWDWHDPPFLRGLPGRDSS